VAVLALGHPSIELAEPLIARLHGHRSIDERAVDLALEVSTPALDLLARGRVRHGPSVPFAFGDVEGRRVATGGRIEVPKPRCRMAPEVSGRWPR
jgi:hypothetical protein